MTDTNTYKFHSETTFTSETVRGSYRSLDIRVAWCMITSEGSTNIYLHNFNIPEDDLFLLLGKWDEGHYSLPHEYDCGDESLKIVNVPTDDSDRPVRIMNEFFNSGRLDRTDCDMHDFGNNHHTQDSFCELRDEIDAFLSYRKEDYVRALAKKMMKNNKLINDAFIPPILNIILGYM